MFFSTKFVLLDRYYLQDLIFEERECDRAPQNCSRSAFHCMPQQFSWLITGTFENKTLLKESSPALKYFFATLSVMKEVCMEPFLW